MGEKMRGNASGIWDGSIGVNKLAKNGTGGGQIHPNPNEKKRKEGKATEDDRAFGVPWICFANNRILRGWGIFSIYKQHSYSIAPQIPYSPALQSSFSLRI
jgi:hypothetical protein